jgi:hypothetical protein
MNSITHITSSLHSWTDLLGSVADCGLMFCDYNQKRIPEARHASFGEGKNR